MCAPVNIANPKHLREGSEYVKEQWDTGRKNAKKMLAMAASDPIKKVSEALFGEGKDTSVEGEDDLDKYESADEIKLGKMDRFRRVIPQTRGRQFHRGFGSATLLTGK